MSIVSSVKCGGVLRVFVFSMIGRVLALLSVLRVCKRACVRER